MKKRNGQTDRRKVFSIVCLFFLLGALGGAVAANLLQAAQKAELAAFLETALFQQDAVSCQQIFWKYLKYALFIWLGGWKAKGLFISAGVFLFRSIAVGFTSAAVCIAYGVKGVWMVITSFLPQNLVLIPLYSILMTAAVYKPEQRELGKRMQKRERRRRRAEYGMLFAGAMVVLLLAVWVEKVILL